MKTVLITGCSTGFGREIALHFHDRGWNVVATMRDPAASTLPVTGRLHVLPLDVTDPAGIAAVMAQAGPVDVLVNNAGIGWFNALEGTAMETAHAIFETNLFGVMAMMQAALPAMRARGSGVVVNIGSSLTLKPIALLSVYRASKAALNALTETVALELEPFGIRARVVMPGMAPSTSFAATVHSKMAAGDWFPQPYEAFAQQVLAGLQAAGEGDVTIATDVAQAAYRAATDPDCPMILPAGPDAIAWARAA